MISASPRHRSEAELDQEAERVLEYAYVHLAHGCSPDDAIAMGTIARFANHDAAVLERAGDIARELATVSRTFVFVSDLLQAAGRRAGTR